MATCERAAAAAQHAGGNPRAAAAGLLRRKGAAHTGEDTTVHRRDRGGSKAAGMRRRQARPAGHGGRALARAAGAREGRQEANGERRVSRGGSGICIWGAGGRAARGDGEGTQRPCKKATRHIVEHVVRVEVSRAGVSSGWLQAELVTGPKTKFEACELLYIFHLETKVIRALQQWVIKPQTVSVSALITVTEIHFRKSNSVQVFACSSP